MNYLMAQTLNNKMMYNGIKAGDIVSEKDKCYYCEEEDGAGSGACAQGGGE